MAQQSDPEADPKTVERHLAAKAQGHENGRQQLVFDPTTGQLVVKNPSADALTIDSIADQGFFSASRR